MGWDLVGQGYFSLPEVMQVGYEETKYFKTLEKDAIFLFEENYLEYRFYGTYYDAKRETQYVMYYAYEMLKSLPDVDLIMCIPVWRRAHLINIFKYLVDEIYAKKRPKEYHEAEKRMLEFFNYHLHDSTLIDLCDYYFDRRIYIGSNLIDKVGVEGVETINLYCSETLE